MAQDDTPQHPKKPALPPLFPRILILASPDTEARDVELLDEIVRQIASDVGLTIDQEIAIGEIAALRASERANGRETIHISFKLACSQGTRTDHGCLLIPLPDALGIAGHLMMMPVEAIDASRGRTSIDRDTKDALLEVGNFVAGSIAAVVHNRTGAVRVHFEGCQGVRADIRPNIPYEEGDELVVGRVAMTVGAQPEFEAVLMLPALPDLFDAPT